MADEVKPPVAIRITRPFATEDEFLEREFDTMTRTSVVLLGAQPRPQGVILRFEIVLTNGQSVLRGEGRVVAFKPIAHGNEPGLTLRFTRLDSKSKELVDRAAALREARIRLSGMPEARKSGQMPAVQVPRPPPPFTQPIVSSPFSAPTSAASMPTASSAGAPEATIAQRQPSSRPPPLPPAAAAPSERRRTVPPPLPPSAFANAPRPQPPLPARFAELDIESTHVESLPSSSLDSEPPAEPSPVSSRPPLTEARVSSQPPSSEEPFKLSQPRISSLPPAPVHPSYSPAAGTPLPPPIVEPFPLDPDAARARESGIPSPFVPPPVFVPPPSAPLPYVPSAYDIVREGERPRDPLELEPLPFAPISDPSLSERISVDSIDAEPPGLLTFQDEPVTSVEPEPPPAAPPAPAMPRVAEIARVSNGHARVAASPAAEASASGAASVTRPADRDALLGRLRNRARELPAERITAILAKRDDARAPRR